MDTAVAAILFVLIKAEKKVQVLEKKAKDFLSHRNT
tara:strand:+ start:138 stop:245 length:108 start_codon:yes stop_codon:yes gene_type:complete